MLSEVRELFNHIESSAGKRYTHFHKLLVNFYSSFSRRSFQTNIILPRKEEKKCKKERKKITFHKPDA